jgi:hypothetical protein
VPTRHGPLKCAIALVRSLKCETSRVTRPVHEAKSSQMPLLRREGHVYKWAICDFYRSLWRGQLFENAGTNAGTPIQRSLRRNISVDELKMCVKSAIFVFAVLVRALVCETNPYGHKFWVPSEQVNVNTIVVATSNLRLDTGYLECVLGFTHSLQRSAWIVLRLFHGPSPLKRSSAFHAKLVQTFTDRGCSVVSVTDPLRP